MEHTPDAWVLVRISGTGVPKPYTRVLAGWRGGYMQGDAWMLSSGVIECVETQDCYIFTNHSGSIYTCGKDREHTTALTQSIFNNYAASNNSVFAMHIQKAENL